MTNELSMVVSQTRIVETVVAADARRLGMGTRMISCAVEESRAAGCEWLHPTSMSS
jgi:tRNA(Met) C34 N-acetyltransferase TmcA